MPSAARGSDSIERVGILQAERPARRSRQRAQVGARADPHAEVPRDRPDVGARRAGDLDHAIGSPVPVVPLRELDAVDRDRSGRELGRLADRAIE
jgi:hypothetical protein